MQNKANAAVSARPSARKVSKPSVPPIRIALDESELATRWNLSVKTLRRWRQDHRGPKFCKLGSRVTYLISEVENFERRVSRYSTADRVEEGAAA